MLGALTWRNATLSGACRGAVWGLSAMYFLRSVCAVCAICALPSNVLAEPIDGNTIYNACKSDDPMSAGFCLGYTFGSIEAQKMGAFISLRASGVDLNTGEMNMLIDGLLGRCIPENVINSQLVDVVKKFLAENPARRHESARSLIWEALTVSFPCGD